MSFGVLPSFLYYSGLCLDRSIGQAWRNVVQSHCPSSYSGTRRLEIGRWRRSRLTPGATYPSYRLRYETQRANVYLFTPNFILCVTSNLEAGGIARTVDAIAGVTQPAGLRPGRVNGEPVWALMVQDRSHAEPNPRPAQLCSVGQSYATT